MAALARTRRDGARQARELALEIADLGAQEGLRKYADELELQAAELEAQIAALNGELASGRKLY